LCDDREAPRGWARRHAPSNWEGVLTGCGYKTDTPVRGVKRNRFPPVRPAPAPPSTLKIDDFHTELLKKLERKRKWADEKHKEQGPKRARKHVFRQVRALRRKKGLRGNHFRSASTSRPRGGDKARNDGATPLFAAC